MIKIRRNIYIMEVNIEIHRICRNVYRKRVIRGQVWFVILDEIDN